MSILNFILFCKYDQVFILSWLFKKNKDQLKAPKTFIYKRLGQGLYIFISWSKARVLYYANNWIYTTNHKRIAVNYFWFVILSGIFGMVLATVIRLELAYPGVGIFAGDSLQYLSLATAHGVIMVFFMIIPLISGAFANFLLPTQLGVHDVAFPRLNSAAFWFLPGGLMMLGQLICLDRRYQRMNCFNIREAQAILKKRFFIDLINSNDHHVLLAKTMLGLRFKTQDLSILRSNGHLSSVYGLSHLLANRQFASSFTSSQNTFSNVTTYSIHKILIFFDLSKILHFFADLTLNIILFLQKPFSNIHLFLSYSISNFFSIDLNIEKLSNFFETFNFYIISTTILNSFKNFLPLNTIYSNMSHFTLYKFGFSLDSFAEKEDEYQKTFQLFYNFPNFTNLNFFFSWDFLKSLNSIYNFFLIYLQNIFFSICEFFVSYQTLAFYHFYKISKLDVAQKKIFSKITRFSNYSELTIFSKNYNVRAMQDETNDSWEFLLRSFYDYWTSTGSTVFNSIEIFYDNLFKIKTARTLGLAHKNYSDFLSLWYLPTVFNQDDLPFRNGLNLVENSNYFVSNFWFTCFLLRNLTLNYYSTFIYVFKNYDLTVFFWKSFLFDSLIFFKLNLSFVLLFISSFYNFTSNFIHFLFNTKNLFIFNKANFFDNVKISSDSLKFNNLNSHLLKLFDNEETSNSHRGLRFNNPVFCYDYRSGDYFPKFYQENITYLIPTFAKITGGNRTPTWFLSENAAKVFDLHLKDFFDVTKIFKLKKKFFISSRPENRSSPTFFFFNFFGIFNNTKTKVPFYWTPFASLTEKFEVMFTNNSMQERMYSNWRQLKFTREAWRCKLLMVRHQKSLFRRYVRESGIFWAIERNARDLLPGWAMITPFSSRTRFTAIGKVDIGVSAILLVLISSVISGANFLVTYRYLSTLNNRKMRDARSFFTEGIMCSSWMMIAANPMLMIGLIMLLSDRHWQTSFFDYSGGGDTILFQHMFWFFGHPEVYIVIIPTFGFVNTLFSYYLRKRISARASLLYSIYTIAFLGFFVWGHHMYMVGLSHTTRMLFSTLTVMISVPAATKLMHWCVTLVNSSFVVELPFLFMLTYVFLFVSGGISGMCVAHTGMDILFHDTFYVIGHFHVMFAGAAMFGSFGAFYFYFSAIFGVKYSRVYAYMHFIYYLLGQLLTVIPMFWLGYAGMPRRVLDYPSAFGGWHSIITAGHMLSVAGLIAFFMMIFDSLRQSKAATRTTLGIIRYNTRLNFYFYEASRISFAQQKGSYQYRYFRPTSFKLNGFHYTNYEYLETTLYSYTFNKRK